MRETAYQPSNKVSTLTEPALCALGLVKRYQKTPVVDVGRLEVMPQEIHVILGPNGAGKSTLLRLLALLERPDQGELYHFGQLVTPRNLQMRRNLAVVFQRPLLFQGTVKQNLALALRFRRLSKKEVCARIDEVVELLGLGELVEQDIRSLSGGELQRVAIGRALAVRPKLLFLDEPTSNLDADIRRRLREDIRRAVKQVGTTVVLVTHEPAEALHLGDRISVMDRGKLVQTGTPEEVFSRPVNAFVASFTGAETIWHGSVVVSTDGLSVVCTRYGLLVQVPGDFQVGDEVVLALRPEEVALRLPVSHDGHGEAHEVTSVRNRWRGTVASTVRVGPLVRVVVKLEPNQKGRFGLQTAVPVLGGEGEIISLVTVASANVLSLEPGTEVEASIKAAAIQVFNVESSRRDNR